MIFEKAVSKKSCEEGKMSPMVTEPGTGGEEGGGGARQGGMEERRGGEP